MKTAKMYAPKKCIFSSLQKSCEFLLTSTCTHCNIIFRRQVWWGNRSCEHDILQIVYHHEIRLNFHANPSNYRVYELKQSW